MFDGNGYVIESYKLFHFAVLFFYLFFRTRVSFFIHLSVATLLISITYSLNVDIETKKMALFFLPLLALLLNLKKIKKLEDEGYTLHDLLKFAKFYDFIVLLGILLSWIYVKLFVFG